MVLAALSGGELIIVMMAVVALVFMVGASVLGIFTRLTRGRVSRPDRDRIPPSSSSPLD